MELWLIMNILTEQKNSFRESEPEIMPKQVSSLNTFLLAQYIETHYLKIDPNQLLGDVHKKGPFFIENLNTGCIEPVSSSHICDTRYWFSNFFMITFYNVIQKHIPDPDLAYKIGKTAYHSQSIFKTAIGIPLIGPSNLLKRIAKENRKYNRTKKNIIIEQSKHHVVIRIVHDPNILINDFAMNWHRGIFESYTQLSGATNVSINAEIIDKGPEKYGDPGQAIWEFDIRFKNKPLIQRIFDIILFNIPSVKKIIKDSTRIQDEQIEQILQRDKIIECHSQAMQNIQKQIFDQEKKLIENKLKTVSKELITAEERERQTLSEDLHDSVSQSLGFSISTLKNILEQDSIDSLDEIKSVNNELEVALSEIRSLTFQMNPPILLHFGLVPAIEWLVADTNKKGDLKIRLNNNMPKNQKVPDTTQKFLYRSVRELIINILKHSKALTAKITISIFDNNLVVSIEDDGIGFEPKTIFSRKKLSYGLHSISNRIKNIDGDMEINSEPGKGTHIILLAPLTQKS